MTAEVAIIKKENLQQIISGAPQSYNDNKTSHDNCIARGQQLLQAVQQQGGLKNDELDEQIASFIAKTRNTLKKMNERRSPFTKLFDQVRTQFTQIENEIDPSKQGTVPYQLQVYRNQYAAEKLKAQQEAQRKAMLEKQHKDALDRIFESMKNDFEKMFQDFLTGSINMMQKLNEAITLENYDASMEQIKNVPTVLPEAFVPGMKFTQSLSYYPGVTPAEAAKKETEAKNALANTFAEQYRYEIETNRDYILDRLPSKKKELEKIATANAEEAERLKKEKEEREKEEKERLEAEKQKKLAEAEEAKKLEQKQKEMAGLFEGQAIAAAGPSTKAKVTKKIHLLDPEGILPVISMWWSHEGKNLTAEELMKKFKSQITFCEKLANKDGVTIKSEFVEYVDEVKVK